MKVIAKPTQGIIVTMCGKNHFASHKVAGVKVSEMELSKVLEPTMKKAS